MMENMNELRKAECKQLKNCSVDSGNTPKITKNDAIRSPIGDFTTWRDINILNGIITPNNNSIVYITLAEVIVVR